MKSKFIAIIFFCFAQSVFVSNVIADPTSCPTAAAIKAAGVNKAAYSPTVGWYAYNPKHNFGTDYEWTFGLINLNDVDESNVIPKANEKLGTLTLMTGPKPGDPGQWICWYKGEQADGRLRGVAVTPPVNMPNVFTISR